MAYTVTLQSIADRARLHADMKSSGYISDTEILSLINEAYAELYDELMGSYENYFTARSEPIVLVGGTTEYSLPADFYKLHSVDFQVNSGTYISLRPFNEGERNRALTNNLSLTGTVYLNYAPAPTIFTSLSQTFDGIAGWDRLMSLLVAIDMLDSEESDSSALTRKYARTLQRVRDMAAPRDDGMPGTVVDVYRTDYLNIYGSLRYRLYGSTIHFIDTTLLGGPDIFV